MDEMPDELQNGSQVAFLFYGVAVALIGYGFFTMFAYNPGTDYEAGFGEVVGGDAYNYIIIGVRGVGFIVAGGVATLMGMAATVAHEHRRTRWVMERK